MALSAHPDIMSSNGFLAECSLDTIVGHALTYEKDKDISDLEVSENVSLVLHFLRHIWAALTDTGLYPSIKRTSVTDYVIPFIHSAESRKEVSERILEFLSHFQEEATYGSDSSSSGLSYVAQGHVLTCFKILSSFLLSRKGREEVLLKFNHATMHLIDVFMFLVPHAIDFFTFLDLLNELVKVLPPESTRVFADFLYERMDFLSSNIKELSASPSTSRLLQTSGAKLIGLVRALETSLREVPVTDESIRIFKLRVLLTGSLPRSHLGVCNRQSSSVKPDPIIPAGQDEWNRLVSLSIRKRSQEISQFELTNYETVAGVSGFSSAMSGQVFDIKALVGRADTRVDPAADTLVLPSYTVYCNYCDVLNFIYRPDIITEMTHDQLEELSNKFTSVTNFFMSVVDKPCRCDAKLEWVIEFRGHPAYFLAACYNMHFWEGFFCGIALAFQTLKISQKVSAPTESVYSMLREKSSETVDSMEKTFQHCLSRVGGLFARVDRFVNREKEWVMWKQRGCPESVPEPVSDDVLTLPSLPPECDYSMDDTDMEQLMEMLEYFEHVSAKDSSGLPEIGTNCRVVVDNLRFDRQAEAWYLPKCSNTADTCTAHEKLCQKLDEYVEKMRMDSDPANGIEESERSKHDVLFRFRFNRLFSVRHLHKYMELSNEELASGSLDCLVNSIHPPGKAAQKKPRKKAKA